MSVQSTLKAIGVAQVIVTLKSVPPGNSAALAAAGLTFRKSRAISIAPKTAGQAHSRSPEVAKSRQARSKSIGISA